uniref:Uncharacterized protein n=1 Tax=Cacopsylla melanoneura TaxID=428564 RepID=A0A8D8RM27_9HEMI
MIVTFSFSQSVSHDPFNLGFSFNHPDPMDPCFRELSKYRQKETMRPERRHYRYQSTNLHPVWRPMGKYFSRQLRGFTQGTMSRVQSGGVCLAISQFQPVQRWLRLCRGYQCLISSLSPQILRLSTQEPQ